MTVVNNCSSHIKQLNKEREKIAKDVERFLHSGGKIKKLKTNESSNPSVHPQDINDVHWKAKQENNQSDIF